MKKMFYVMLSVIAIVTMIIVACEKRNVPDVDSGITDAGSKYSVDVIASKPITIEGSELVLPAGTRIQVAKDKYSIDVTLPEGYGFLYRDSAAGAASMKTLPVLFAAAYMCKCSGSSNCQVFYQEQAGGFGCLHQSCSGSCTGSFVTSKSLSVYGIIKLSDKDINIPKDLPFTPASLTPGAKRLFFEIPEVQEKIAEQYELMYRFIPKPDFRSVDPEHQSLRDYVFVRAQLYGVDFYFLGPAEFSKRTDLFEVYTAKASCKCGDAAGACSMGSGGFLGWKVYYCTGGCNGCQLTITKAVSPSINLPDNHLPLKPVPADIPRNF